MTDVVTPILDYPMPRKEWRLPPPAYARLREAEPCKVRLGPDRTAWLVTRYEDVRTAIADYRVSSDDMQEQFPALIPLPPTPRALSFFRMDNPDHARLRRMVIPEFTARATRALLPDIERIAGGLVDDLLAGPNPTDFMAGFSDPLPTLVIARLLGVPYDDHAFFQEKGRICTSSDATPEQALGAFIALTEYFEELVSRKQKDPGDDLISRLCERYLARDEISRPDLIAMVRFLLFAGHDTTANQISMSILLLLVNPEQKAQVRDDLSLVPSAVEELLRFASIKQHDFIRTAAVDMTIGGVEIKAGEGIIFALPSANHDGGAFPDPDRLDVRRDAHHHLAFGHGPHKCVGAPLATMELEVSLATVLTRMPGLALAGRAEDLPFRDEMLLYGVHELPVTW